MNQYRQILCQLKGRLDALVEPPIGPPNIELECVKQGKRLKYRSGAGLFTSATVSPAERQARNRAFNELIDKGMLVSLQGKQKRTRCDFTERGLQTAESLCSQAPVSHLVMLAEDVYSYETETPIGFSHLGARWIPFWAVAMLPEWGQSREERREQDKILVNNTYMDITAMLARGWLDAAADARGENYIALTDAGRKVAGSPENHPPSHELPKRTKQDAEQGFNTYINALQAETERLKQTPNHAAEVYIGVPCGAWQANVVQWVNESYWKFRNTIFGAECSECGKRHDAPRDTLTCSKECERKRAVRLKAVGDSGSIKTDAQRRNKKADSENRNKVKYGHNKSE